MSVMSANPELQKKLRNFIEECGSQIKAARALGKSTATLSTYLNNRYNGNLSDFEKFLTETFETKAAAENLKSAQVLNSYKPTSISTEVYDTIRLCHLKGGLAIECGDAGIGKTMACKKYAEDYPATAIYVSVNPCLVTLSAFLKLLCRTQKITATGRKDEMWLRLADSFEGERKVLIIDEAQHLPIKTIEAIRAFLIATHSLAFALSETLKPLQIPAKAKKRSLRFVTVQNLPK